jgi:AbrB family looped-hinge helix DNA binding protein
MRRYSETRENIVAVGKVRANGEITLPPDVREAIGVAPGDLVSINVTEQGTIEIRRFVPMRLADALERYRIERPIDEVAVRDEWQEIAARDILGTSEHG